MWNLYFTTNNLKHIVTYESGAWLNLVSEHCSLHTLSMAFNTCIFLKGFYSHLKLFGGKIILENCALLVFLWVNVPYISLFVCAQWAPSMVITTHHKRQVSSPPPPKKYAASVIFHIFTQMFGRYDEHNSSVSSVSRDTVVTVNCSVLK